MGGHFGDLIPAGIAVPRTDNLNSDGNARPKADSEKLSRHVAFHGGGREAWVLDNGTFCLVRSRLSR